MVATPIGNLGDMTPRAIETLQSVSLIAAEDTRVTQKLLSAFDIHTPLISCHEHNERGKAAGIVRRMLEEGIDVAVTTDAGTPCISDPGSVLVREAVQNGIEAVAVPGPTAMASALSVSGFAISEFTFFGFLPRQKGELKEKLLGHGAQVAPGGGARIAASRAGSAGRRGRNAAPHPGQRQLRSDQKIRKNPARSGCAGAGSPSSKTPRRKRENTAWCLNGPRRTSLRRKRPERAFAGGTAVRRAGAGAKP